MTYHPSYRPNPGIGDVISQSLGLLRRRPGLFFGLGAVSALAALLSGIAMVAIAGMGWVPFIMAVARQDLARVGELLLAWFGIVLAGGLVAGIVSLLVVGLLTRLAGDSLTGKQPTLPELLRTLGGFARRMLPLAALGVVAYLVATGLLLLPMARGISTLADPFPDTEALGFGILISVLLFLPISLLAVFLGVRLLYLTQVVSLEELGWTTALRRAWSLTRGAFWRTTGTLIVVYLLIYAVTMVVNLGTQFATIGALEGLETANPLSPDFLGRMAGAMAVPMVAQALLQVVTTPFIQVAITVMYVNRTRELAAPAPGPGYPPAPYGYPPAPYGPANAGYGQGAPPPYGYGSAYPQPSQGYGQASPPGYGQPPGYGSPYPQPPQGYGQASPPGYGRPPGYGTPQGSGAPPQGPAPAGQPPQGYGSPPRPGEWQPPAAPPRGPSPYGQQPPTDQQG